MTNQLPDESKLAIRVMAMPADTNATGDIFGGWLMSQVDIAGSLVARRHAQGRVATVAVNSFEFHQPVFVGDVISCYTEITRVGHTSLTVNVRAYAERQQETRQREAELQQAADQAGAASTPSQADQKKAARKAVQDAEKDLEEARQVREGDRKGTASGGSRLTPEYLERVREAEAEVDRARQQAK